MKLTGYILSWSCVCVILNLCAMDSTTTKTMQILTTGAVCARKTSFISLRATRKVIPLDWGRGKTWRRHIPAGKGSFFSKDVL